MRRLAGLCFSVAPRPSPTLRLLRNPATIDGYRIEDFQVEGYAPHDAIKADVAV